jgi:hypothetical protein
VDTSISWKAKTIISSSGSQTGWIKIDNNTNNDMTSEMKMLSKSMETDNSIIINASMSTNNPYLSPVIDLSRAYSILVGNIINDDDENETSPSGGNALAKYITDKITLADGQDAEDVKVYITGYKPSGTRIKIYAKILNAEDSDIFDDRPYIELEGSPINRFSDNAAKDFTEMEFGFPEDILTGNNGAIKYTNSKGIEFSGYKYIAIKIVLLSPSTSVIPICAEGLRAICLQK